jgi:hypothetical protein
VKKAKLHGIGAILFILTFGFSRNNKYHSHHSSIPIAKTRRTDVNKNSSIDEKTE